jgi:hypothetical protein
MRGGDLRIGMNRHGPWSRDITEAKPRDHTRARVVSSRRPRREGWAWATDSEQLTCHATNSLWKITLPQLGTLSSCRIGVKRGDHLFKPNCGNSPVQPSLLFPSLTVITCRIPARRPTLKTLLKGGSRLNRPL